MKPAVRAQLLVDFAALTINDFGDSGRAITLLREATELVPNNYVYRKMLVNILALSGNHQSAIDELERMLAIKRWKDISFEPNEQITQMRQQLRQAISENQVPVD